MKTLLNFAKKASKELIDEAFSALKTAKEIHDELESCYIEAMDFDKVEEKAKNLIKVVWRDGYINNAFAVFRDNPNLEEVTADFSKIVTLDYYCFRAKVKIINSDWTSLKNMKREAMTSTQLNKESALRLFNTVPTWTDTGEHNIAIGIHIDHQADEEVLAAISNAEAKGWTLEVRWNGTPITQTTSTFSLRKPPIYAKVSELERSDASKEQILNWGHYVTNPEDYQEFSSLEEAYEHFGLSNDLEKLNNSEQ